MVAVIQTKGKQINRTQLRKATIYIITTLTKICLHVSGLSHLVVYWG